MREYGVVRKGLTGDGADPAATEAASPYIGTARTLLGQMKNRMQLGGVTHLSRTVNLPDGTTIQVTSSNGQDTIRINAASTPRPAVREEAHVINESTEFEPELPEIPEIVNNSAEFYVLPGSFGPSQFASTLPWTIAGKQYATYPAGLKFASGSSFTFKNPSFDSDQIMLLGLIALNKFGGQLPQKQQPTNWVCTNQPVILIFTADQIQSALPDSGPPYFATAYFNVPAGKMTEFKFRGTTKEPVPQVVTAVLKIGLPKHSYEYTYIDFGAYGQSISNGLTLAGPSNGAYPFNGTMSWGQDGHNVYPPEEDLVHGSQSYTITLNLQNQPMPPNGGTPDGYFAFNINQTWTTKNYGSLPATKYASLGAVMDDIGAIMPPGGVCFQESNTSQHVRSTPPDNTTNSYFYTLRLHFFTSADAPSNYNETVVFIVDADNSWVQFTPVKSVDSSGLYISNGSPLIVPFSYGLNALYKYFPAFQAATPGLPDAVGGVGLGIGTSGKVVMNRKQIELPITPL
jgi:hypothetical protein